MAVAIGATSARSQPKASHLNDIAYVYQLFNIWIHSNCVMHVEHSPNDIGNSILLLGRYIWECNGRCALVSPNPTESFCFFISFSISGGDGRRFVLADWRSLKTNYIQRTRLVSMALQPRLGLIAIQIVSHWIASMWLLWMGPLVWPISALFEVSSKKFKTNFKWRCSNQNLARERNEKS